MGPSSWLRSVKRALKSQTTGSERNCERDEEYRKKREKERWIFGTPPPYGEETKHREDGNIASSSNATTTRKKSTDKRILGPRLHVSDEEDAEQRRAFAVAMATSAATEAAVATARAAVEVIRLATPSIIFLEHYAAVMIQAAFRGYPRERNKAVAIDTWAPENQGQNLLINSIASPQRSRIRTLKAQSTEREKEAEAAAAAAREGEREICGGDGLSCEMERLSFAGSDLYI